MRRTRPRHPTLSKKVNNPRLRRAKVRPGPLPPSLFGVLKRNRPAQVVTSRIPVRLPLVVDTVRKTEAAASGLQAAHSSPGSFKHQYGNGLRGGCYHFLMQRLREPRAEPLYAERMVYVWSRVPQRRISARGGFENKSPAVWSSGFSSRREAPEPRPQVQGPPRARAPISQCCRHEHQHHRSAPFVRCWGPNPNPNPNPNRNRNRNRTMAKLREEQFAEAIGVDTCDASLP
jgi:hypothetical protein